MWIGNNVAGATSKWATVKRLIRVKSPSILSLQETKFRISGRHKLDGYVTYEHLRKEKTAGGGILLAVLQELKPALVRDGGENVEALTVEIKMKQMQVICSTAYGPQENDSKHKKDLFWQYIEEDILRAQIEGKGYILQGDLNAWLGNKIIPNDPRPQNSNGKIMADMLKRNHLTVVNGLQLCKGLFTRIQNRKGTYEKSIIDFFVVSEQILPHITSMEIDEKKINIISNYTQVRRGGKVVDSDHVPLEMNLDLKVIPTRPTRSIVYNFKNEQGRNTFTKLTSETIDFSNCFLSVQPLQNQCELWKQTLETYCKKSFPRIRLKKRKIMPSSADTFIKQRNIMKKKQEENLTNHEEDLKIKDLEETISDILAREEMLKINQFKKFSASHGSICVSEMWKLKQKLWPKKSESIPTGKINHKGEMVTAPDNIKKSS